jgi:hypothetical protein
VSDVTITKDHALITVVCRALCGEMKVPLESIVIGDQEPKTLSFPVVLQVGGGSSHIRKVVISWEDGGWLWASGWGHYQINEGPEGVTLKEIGHE